MPTTTRTIRVFISSTFSELKAERNALQERVFPCLKRYCQHRGCSFRAIDLRWGISNEAALDQSIMRICRTESACWQAVTPRPNFVALPGDRRDWVAEPEQLRAREHSQRQQVKWRSITEGEVRHAVFNTSLASPDSGHRSSAPKNFAWPELVEMIMVKGTVLVAVQFWT
jgi:hypothetical protein